jgi:hypothetical protein
MQAVSSMLAVTRQMQEDSAAVLIEIAVNYEAYPQDKFRLQIQ